MPQRRTSADTVLERLLRGLAACRWEPGANLPPVRQLARDFAASRAAVVSALHRAAASRLIQVRQRRPVRVLAGAPEAARRLLAKLPRYRHGPSIAVVTPESFLRPGHVHGIFAVLNEDIVREAAHHNMNATVVALAPEEQLSFARTLAKRGFDAAIFTGLTLDYLVSLTVLHAQAFPALLFNYHVPGLDLPSVFIEDYSASQRVAANLVALGHRNLCMVSQETAPVRNVRHNMRVPGWLNYLAEHDLVEGCTLPIYSPLWTLHLDPWSPTFRKALAGPDRPTALVFAHDPWARLFLREPAFASLAIPDQISLVTFESDRTIPSVPWCPPLSTVHVDYQRVAECMIEMVTAMLAGNLKPANLRVPLRIEMTESIGPVPADVTPSDREAR